MKKNVTRTEDGPRDVSFLLGVKVFDQPSA